MKTTKFDHGVVFSSSVQGNLFMKAMPSAAGGTRLYVLNESGEEASVFLDEGHTARDMQVGFAKAARSLLKPGVACAEWNRMDSILLQMKSDPIAAMALAFGYLDETLAESYMAIARTKGVQ